MQCRETEILRHWDSNENENSTEEAIVMVPRKYYSATRTDVLPAVSSTLLVCWNGWMSNLKNRRKPTSTRKWLRAITVLVLRMLLILHGKQD